MQMKNEFFFDLPNENILSETAFISEFACFSRRFCVYLQKNQRISEWRIMSALISWSL